VIVFTPLARGSRHPERKSISQAARNSLYNKGLSEIIHIWQPLFSLPLQGMSTPLRMIQRILTQPFQRTQTRIKLLIAAAVAQGLGVLIWMLSTPSDPDVRRFLGYSSQRWMIILAVGLLTGLCVLALLRLLRYATAPKAITLPHPGWLLPAVSAAGLCLLAVDVFGMQWLDVNLNAVVARITPLAVLISLISIEMIVLPWAATPESQPPGWTSLGKAARVWAALVAFGLVIGLTRFGLVKVSNGWYEYGVPLMHEQAANLLMGAAVAFLAAAIASRLLNKVRVSVLAVDLLLAGLVWGAAVLTWSPMPIPHTWMSPKPLAPNFAVYPYSDAALYDTAAQGTLLGAAWARTEVHYKPLYVGFLTLAHAAVGLAYQPVVQLQVLVLAFFPVMLYLLGKNMHSRLAGILAAAAAVIREYNQLAVASLTTTSNTKLLLSELPTALGISILLLILVVWVRRLRRDSVLPLLAGGVIGCIVQIRLQTVLFLPGLMAFLFFYARPREYRRWLGVCGLLLIGFSASLAPLVVRNILATGQITIEKPGYFERTVAYSFTPTSTNPSSAAQADVPIPEARQTLLSTVWLSGSHFVHNLAHTLLVLPSGYGAVSAWTRPADLSSLFWVQYLAPLTLLPGLWILFNLALIALGIQSMWQKNRQQALLPLFMLLVYDLSSAFGGFSGQRFFLPVDWVGYFYFFAGAAWLCAGLLRFMRWPLSSAEVSAQPAGSSRPDARPVKPGLRLVGAAGLLLVLGLVYPAAQAIIPVRYAQAGQPADAAAFTRLAQTALNPADQAKLAQLLTRPDVEILHGAALYPRRMANIDDSAGVNLPDAEVGYPYLSYTFVGQRKLIVLQPLGPEALVFPHAAEVFVAGWVYQGRFHAFATALPGEHLFYFSPQ
jgi:hypothetical protein